MDLNKKYALMVTSAAVVLLYLSSMFAGYAYAGCTASYSDDAEEQSIGVNESVIQILDETGAPISGTLFDPVTVMYRSQWNSKVFVDSQIISGERGIRLTGTSEAFTFGVSSEYTAASSADPSVPLQVALSEVSDASASSLMYVSIPVNGSFVSITPTNASGQIVDGVVGKTYYIYLKVVSSTFSGTFTGAEDISLTFGARTGYRSSDYIASENAIMVIGIKDVVRKSSSGSAGVITETTVRDESGNVHPAANLMYESGGQAVIIGGKEKSYTMSVADGYKFAIKVDAYNPKDSSKMTLSFEIKYKENGVYKTLKYTTHVTTRTYLGVSPGSTVLNGYSSLDVLDSNDGWIAGAGITDITITVSGFMKSGTYDAGGRVTTTVIFR